MYSKLTLSLALLATISATFVGATPQPEPDMNVKITIQEGGHFPEVSHRRHRVGMSSNKPVGKIEYSFCHGPREPCDRQDQCCPGLRCNLDDYECQPYRILNINTATNKPVEKVEHSFCHEPEEPCDRQDQCCPGLHCNLGAYECQPYSGQTVDASSKKPVVKVEYEFCHGYREPCDRPDQCCPGLQCNLDQYECEPRQR